MKVSSNKKHREHETGSDGIDPDFQETTKDVQSERENKIDKQKEAKQMG